MFTVGPSSMSRPSAADSWPSACPSRFARSTSQAAASAAPDGNAVATTVGSAADSSVLSSRECQLRTPSGPSLILMAGIPRRSLGTVSIQLRPDSMAAFSSALMRPSRSWTRCSTGTDGFL